MLDFSKYKILTPTREEIKEWCLKIHYAKRIPNVMYSFGLYCNSSLLCIVTYGMPASQSLMKSPFGGKYMNLIIELNRIITQGQLEKNLLSWFIAQTIHFLPKPMIIISYSDLSMNHYGYIYQALNFYYTGTTKERTDINSSGHQRHYSKTINYSENRKTRSSKNRYLYLHLDKKTKINLLKELKWEILTYPKGASQRYTIDYKPIATKNLFNY